MRYTTSVVKPAPKARKPFDMVATLESLSTTLDQMHAAYEEVVASEGRVLEAEQILADCSAAYESIKQYGVSAENMMVLNQDHCLDKALGLENLQLTAIESLAASTKAVLQNTYCAGLEALAVEQKKSFVQKVKDFIAKIWNWIKEFFTGDAKVVALLKELKFEGTLDGEKKIVAWSKSEANDVFETLKACSDALQSGGGTAETDPIAPDDSSTEWKIPERKNDSVSALGWSLADAKAMRDKLVAEVKDRAAIKASVDKTVADVKDKTSKISFKEAATTGYEEGKNAHGGSKIEGAVGAAESVYEKATKGFQMLRWKAKTLGIYGKLYRGLAFTLIAVDKATKKEETK